MWKLKNDIEFKELEKFGYIKDKKSILPKLMIKVINESTLIKVGIDKPSYNIWSGKCWNESREFRYYAVYNLEFTHKWKDGEIAPYYEGNWSTTKNEIVKPYIDDLIQAGLVEEV